MVALLNAIGAAAIAYAAWKALAQEEAEFTSKHFDAPLYVLHGESDAICFVQGSFRVYNKCVTKDKTLNVVPTPRQGTFSTGGNDEILTQIIVWTEKRLGDSI